MCKQGLALLQFCCDTGMLIFNGRVQGDLHGSPTCFSGPTGSVIDYLIGTASLLMQAATLRVLPEIPEYRGHRPLELILGMPPPSTQHSAVQHASSNPDSDSCGPPPSFAQSLRITPDRLSLFASELEQPATAEQLQHLAETASSDPLQAANQLHSLLYSTAAAVFPPASIAPASHQRHVTPAASCASGISLGSTQSVKQPASASVSSCWPACTAGSPAT